jgi:hypothetical protein
METLILNTNTDLDFKDDGTYCTICYDSLKNDENVVKLSCTHIFHINCLRNSFKYDKDNLVYGNIRIYKCPFCRGTIKTNFVSIVLETQKRCKQVLLNGPNKGKKCSRYSQKLGFCKQHHKIYKQKKQQEKEDLKHVVSPKGKKIKQKKESKAKNVKVKTKDVKVKKTKVVKAKTKVVKKTKDDKK